MSRLSASLLALTLFFVSATAGWWLLRPEVSTLPAQTPTVAPQVPVPVGARGEAAPPEIGFTDVTVSAGIDFRHDNGAEGDKLLPETMGGGAAFFDYDGDGDPDLLLVNSDRWPGRPAEVRPTSRLYRNDGAGHFEDVTAAAGLDLSLYGMGAAVGDVDGDGDLDVFLSAVGHNRLLRNDDGHFVDTTAAAAVAGDADAWSTGAALFDYDRDGDLDLFVANYVRWSKAIDLEVDFRLTGLGRAYGPPMDFAGAHPYLYRNEGGGKFVDVSEAAGVRIANPATGAPAGKGLGVRPLDVDDDGWIDLFVANDTVQNFYFRNRHDGTFAEEAVLAGLAFDRDGRATGGMGVDAGDLHGDGTLSIAIGNFANEMTSLYVSQGDRGQFADEAITSGIGPATRRRLSFGVLFFDYDLDGRLDLLQANGHLEREIQTVQASQRYAQPAQLFWNAGDGRLAEVPPETTGDLAVPAVGRGVAYADIDLDGDLDVLITTLAGAPRLLRNDQQTGHHWLRVRFDGPADGARLRLKVGGRTLHRDVSPARSYLCHVERAVTFGLGDAERVDALEIRWPDGHVQAVDVAAIDTTLRVARAAR